MGLRWAQKNLSPIGVDFGAETIKLLQVQQDDPPQLIAAAERDVPLEARKDAEAYHAFVGEALREMTREAGARQRRVVASISAAQTYVQHVRVQASDAQVTKQQIEMELRGRLPIDPLNMVIRHVPIGQVFSDGAAKQEVICLAASREGVMRSVRAIRQAGMDVVGMHCEPMAILAAFSHLFRRAGDEDRTTFFIDIGGGTTKALIAHGKQLVFAKTIHVAGETFTRQMAQAWELDYGTARQRRIEQAREAAEDKAAQQKKAAAATESEAATERRRGAPVPGMAALNAAITAEEEGATSTDADGPTGGSNAAAASTATAPAPPAHVAPSPGELVEPLVDELQLCAGYHASMFPDRPIEKVVFLGGESRYTDLCQQIARALRVPAQLGDPMARLTCSLGAEPVGLDVHQRQPGWAVPVGLCMLPTNL